MKLADKADYSRKEKEQLTILGSFQGNSLRKGMAVCLSLSLCLLPLLSACQRKEERKEKKKLQIGVTIYDNYDTFLSGYMTAFEKEISKKRAEGVEIGLFRYNAAGSQALQNEQVEEMLEKDCDVLCVNLVDRTAPSEIIDMAKKKNVPIIFFNRELVDEDLAQWNQLYYIGADAKQSGILQGEMAAEDILSEEPEKPTPEVPLASPEESSRFNLSISIGIDGRLRIYMKSSYLLSGMRMEVLPSSTAASMSFFTADIMSVSSFRASAFSA